MLYMGVVCSHNSLYVSTLVCKISILSHAKFLNVGVTVLGMMSAYLSTNSVILQSLDSSSSDLSSCSFSSRVRLSPELQKCLFLTHYLSLHVLSCWLGVAFTGTSTSISIDLVISLATATLQLEFCMVQWIYTLKLNQMNLSTRQL